MTAPHCIKPDSITIAASIAACIGCWCVATVPTERLCEKVHAGTTRFEYYPHCFRVLPLDDWQPVWNQDSSYRKHRRDEVECPLRIRRRHCGLLASCRLSPWDQTYPCPRFTPP